MIGSIFLEPQSNFVGWKIEEGGQKVFSRPCVAYIMTSLYNQWETLEEVIPRLNLFN